jgi:HprK-related kinase B
LLPDFRASPVTAAINLRFLDFQILVETNSLRAASRLQSYFRAYRAAPAGAPDMRLRVVSARPEYDETRMREWERAAGKRPPKESFYDAGNTRYILKNRTGMLIALREDEAAIVGDVNRHLNQAVNLIGTLFGLSLVDKGYAMLHASAVVRADVDEAMIFLGNSGSGKSSLALQLIERGGFDYLSNDRVLLKARQDGVHVVGLPKKPRVNPGTLLASGTELGKEINHALDDPRHPARGTGVIRPDRLHRPRPRYVSASVRSASLLRRREESPRTQ